MDTLTSKRAYHKRRAGDVVNGAILLESVDGHRWKMKCKCGNIFVAIPSDSSGRCRECAYREASIRKTKHGESPSKKKNASRLYRIWLGMNTRCNNPRSAHYGNYGGRGIRVCDEWKSYEKFKDWSENSGYRDDLQIDRIDNDGNYCPENCRWASPVEQARNKRNNHVLTVNGKSGTVAEWAEITGIKRETISRRIKNGKSAYEAVSIIPKIGNNQFSRPELMDIPERKKSADT